MTKIKSVFIVLLAFLSSCFVALTIDYIFDFSGFHLMQKTIGYRIALVKSETTNSASISDEDKIKVTWPARDVGRGTFNISSPSGSSEEGKEVFIYIEKDKLFYQLGISLREMDSSKLTYFYIDDYEAGSEHVGYGYDGTLNVPDEVVKVGKHYVRAVQYEDDKQTGKVTFYHEHIFEFRNSPNN